MDSAAGQTRTAPSKTRRGCRRSGLDGADRDEAVARLQGLLLRASRHEVARRRSSLAFVCGEEFDDIATQAAGDATMAKRTLVQEAGGACALCGYDRASEALAFHHLEPQSKSFGIGQAGCSRSIDSSRREIDKCTLLCANCHAEVEAGIRAAPVK